MKTVHCSLALKVLGVSSYVGSRLLKLLGSLKALEFRRRLKNELRESGSGRLQKRRCHYEFPVHCSWNTPALWQWVLVLTWPGSLQRSPSLLKVSSASGMGWEALRVGKKTERLCLGLVLMNSRTLHLPQRQRTPGLEWSHMSFSPCQLRRRNPGCGHDGGELF